MPQSHNGQQVDHNCKHMALDIDMLKIIILLNTKT